MGCRSSKAVHPYKTKEGNHDTAADPNAGNPFAPRKKSDSRKGRAKTAPENAERSRSNSRKRKKSSQSSRHHRNVSNAGTPNELSVPNSGQNSARNSVGASDRMSDKGDGFGRAGVAMFIPMDKPSSRGNSRGSARSQKRVEELARRLSRTPKKDPQAFIPGTGDEKILIKSRGQKLSELPPIHFHKVGSNRDVKSQIEKDKKMARRKYKKARWTDKHMKKVLYLPPRARTLILDYAEMVLVKPIQAELVVKGGEDNPNSDSRMSRDSLSLSVVS